MPERGATDLRGSASFRSLACAMSSTGGLREVRLPEGWQGLSFEARPSGRLIVTDVPKSCFSSQSFGSSGAQPQVAGVVKGDEIVTMNGQLPDEFGHAIATAGDPLNSCSKASPPHEVGSIGKFDSPPCPSCDFVRVREKGLDVALTLWIRAVKRDVTIVFGIRACDDANVDEAEKVADSTTVGVGSPENGSAAGTFSVMRELKSLDEVRRDGRDEWKQPEARTVMLKAAAAIDSDEDILREADALPSPGFYLRLLTWSEAYVEYVEEDSRPAAPERFAVASPQPMERRRPRPPVEGTQEEGGVENGGAARSAEARAPKEQLRLRLRGANENTEVGAPKEPLRIRLKAVDPEPLDGSERHFIRRRRRRSVDAGVSPSPETHPAKVPRREQHSPGESASRSSFGFCLRRVPLLPRPPPHAPPVAEGSAEQKDRRHGSVRDAPAPEKAPRTISLRGSYKAGSEWSSPSWRQKQPEQQTQRPPDSSQPFSAFGRKSAAPAPRVLAAHVGNAHYDESSRRRSEQ